MEEGIMKTFIKYAMNFTLVFCISAIAAFSGINRVEVYAEDHTMSMSGKIYEFDKGNNYYYSSSLVCADINKPTRFGSFSIAGDIKQIDDKEGFKAYEVDSGVVQLTYSPSDVLKKATDTDWHIDEDNSNLVNGEKIDEKKKIKKGAVILETSSDGEHWIIDLVDEDVLGDESQYVANFYNTKDIQQINGCFYRVIVVYQTARKLGDKIIGVIPKYEYKRYAEIYEFYVKDNSDQIIAGGAHPNTRKVVGDMTNVVNAGKDKGFSEHNDITVKDPHYGWKIGEFSLKGYTNTADYQDEEYFLKTLGDEITLSFNLSQDINCLNGNENLSISEDKNGSDQYFQINKTNLKHGALIIRHTDFEGKKTDPIIYTDYLAAYARTGADTTVKLFEEGDYEVALDYEIKNSSGIDSYTNYRMYFEFKIRNGNNMVYAFDKSSHSQLVDGALAQSGFSIDTANSHYLSVKVDKYSLNDGEGGKSKDLSWSRTANDGGEYTDAGIYVVSVSNKYQPNGTTTKIFYVGSDPFIKALSVAKPSVEKLNDKIDEINKKLKSGYEITSNGTLALSPKPQMSSSSHKPQTSSSSQKSQTNGQSIKLQTNSSSKKLLTSSSSR